MSENREELFEASFEAAMAKRTRKDDSGRILMSRFVLFIIIIIIFFSME